MADDAGIHTSMAAPDPQRQMELRQAYEANLAAERNACAGVRLRSPGEVAWMTQAVGPAGVADLRGADMSRLHLAGAALGGALLLEANLSGANLSGANLGGAVLLKAHLASANLAGANLRDSVLDFADLSNASAAQADLRNASLVGANLAGADLTGALLDEDTDTRDIQTNGATRLPAR